MHDLVIRGARLAGREVLVDVAVADGRVVAVAPDLDAAPAARRIDADGGLVTSSFVEPHFHLDKTMSRDRFGAVSPQEAFSKARDVKRDFTVEDVESRACEALRLAVAHGMGTLRAQVDVDFATRLVSFEGVLRARERYAGLIDVQVVAFPQEGIVTDPEAPALLREALAMGADAVGGLPEIEADEGDQRRHLETVVELAQEVGVALDVHADYLDTPRLKTLELLADLVLERGVEGPVIAGHCCALAVYPDDEAARVIDKVHRAGIDVVVMPMANLQMLGGEGRTPHDRGSSRVKELLDAGVEVAAATDNMYDIWYRFSRMDPLELAFVTCLSAGLRTDEDVEAGFEMVTTRPARILGLPADGVVEGAPADLVVFESGTLVDVLRNLPRRRTVVKGGRIVGGIEAREWVAG